MLASLAAVFLLAGVAPWAGRALGRGAGVAFSLVPFGIVAWMLAVAPGVLAGEAVRESHAWAAPLGLTLSLRLDGLSLLFGLLICGVGGLILIYADGYLADDPRRLRLHAFLLLFMGAMLGAVWSENLLALFVFWELTSVSSYLLIGFDHRRLEARRAALQALLVTGSGGLALLVGILMLRGIGGSYEIPVLLENADAIVRHRLFIPIVLLFAAGAFTKSACFPFHFWLPGAMAAPTPVSAYLHSSTMVKAGIYLLARMAPLFAAAELWGPLLAAFGGTTMVVGAVLGMRERDLKRLLAYSTVSSLGLIVMAIGIGTAAAATAAIAYLLAHALFKGSLFMVAGAIDHGCGERDAERLGGLRHAMPRLFIVSAVAAASMAGWPPLLGFIAKEAIIEQVLAAPFWSGAMLAATVAAAALTVAISLLVGVKPFLGAPAATPHEPHAPGASLLLGPAVLAALGLALGLLPFLAAPLVASAASAIAGEAVTAKLSLWHGFNAALAAGVTALVLGGAAFRFRGAVRAGLGRLGFLDPVGPAAAYEAGLRGLVAISEGQTRVLQSGHLRSYLFITVGTAVGLVGTTLWSRGGVSIDLASLDVRWHEALIAAVIAIAAIAASTARSRITAVAALGLAGFGVAVMFVMYGAPDLAMTQIAIETLTVILFVLVFRRLPDFRTISTGLQRTADVFMAAVAGTLVSLLVLVAADASPDRDAAAWFGANSYLGGYGRNVVNVILVDFRALDTLGEITVLAIAAIGVFALLRPGRIGSRN
jgi:multicomponent Na+:H+ antiporter subunit A